MRLENTMVFNQVLLHTNDVKVQCSAGVIVIICVWSVVDRRFEPRSGQAIYFKIGIFCFSTKHAYLRSKAETSSNQDSVSEWNDMSNHGLLFQLPSTRKNYLRLSVQYKVDMNIISLNATKSRHGIAEQMFTLALTSTHSILFKIHLYINIVPI